MHIMVRLKVFQGGGGGDVRVLHPPPPKNCMGKCANGKNKRKFAKYDLLFKFL